MKTKNFLLKVPILFSGRIDYFKNNLLTEPSKAEIIIDSFFMTCLGPFEGEMEVKEPYPGKKSVLISMRVTEQFIEVLQQMHEKTGATKQKIVRWSVMHYLNNRKSCNYCPDCKKPIFRLASIPTWDGIDLVTCKAGHENYYDWRNEKFIKR